MSNNKIDTLSFITTIWMSGKDKSYPTLNIIPIELAKRFGLDKPCKVLISARPHEKGILIQRYDFDEEDLGDLNIEQSRNTHYKQSHTT